MRNITIRTTTSKNHKRKNLLITESIDSNGLKAFAEKKYCYYVSEQKDENTPEKIKEWFDVNQSSYHKKDRHVSIKKSIDPITGAGQMIYRVIGSFYVVQDMHLFAVVFLHSIKFSMPAALTGPTGDGGFGSDHLPSIY